MRTRSKARSHDFGDLNWVGIGDALAGSPVGLWLKENVPASAIVVTADTFVSVRDCAAAGAGLAVMPCCLGDQTTQLQRVGKPILEMQTGLWILTHPDVRGAARVKAFNEYMTQSLRGQVDLLEGKRR